MNRSVILTVLLGLMVVLAGCNGGLTGDGTTTTGDDLTQTPTPEPQPYTQSGDELSASTLVTDHEAAIRAAETFTNRLTISIDTENGSLVLNTTTRVDLARNVGLENNRLLFEEFILDSTVYTTGTSSFARDSFESNDTEFTEYSKGSEPYDSNDPEPVNATESMQLDIIVDAVDGATWTQVGLEQYDGVSVTRYEAKGVDSFRDLRDDIDPAANNTITNAEAVLLIDQNGIVRFIEITFEVDGDDGAGKLVYRSEITDIGSTTVSEPDWLDKAKNS